VDWSKPRGEGQQLSGSFRLQLQRLLDFLPARIAHFSKDHPNRRARQGRRVDLDPPGLVHLLESGIPFFDQYLSDQFLHQFP